MEKVKAFADGSRSFMTTDIPPRPSSLPPTWTAPPRAASAPPPAPSAAPSPAAPSPAASTASAFTPTDPTAILDELVESIDGVRAAILVSVDGFGRARSSSISDEPSHAAMLAAAIGLAHQLVVMGGGQQLRQLVVDHDGGLMLVWPIGDERVLAVIATTTVEQRRVRAFVQSRVAWFTGARS